MGNVPAFQPQLPEAEEDAGLQPPELMLAMIVESELKQTLALPASLREKWASDPIRKDEWFQELQNFDARQLISSHYPGCFFHLQGIYVDPVTLNPKPGSG